MREFDIGFIHLKYPRSRNISESSAATEYIRYMNDRGANVTVYCPEMPDDPDEVAEDLETHFLDVDFSFPNHKGRELNRAIMSNDSIKQHNIIHCYTGRGIPAVGRLSQNRDLKSIITLNAYNAVCPKNDLLFLNKHNCRSRSNVKCSLCTANDTAQKLKNQPKTPSNIVGKIYGQVNQMQDILVENQASRFADHIDKYHIYTDYSKEVYSKFGFPIKKFETVPIPLDHNFEYIRNHPPDEPYKLLYVGRLSKSKGVYRLPEILTELSRQSDSNIQLTIVGSGGDMVNELPSLFNQNDLSNQVTFEGYIPNPELPKVYENHDLFIYPGRVDEAFGRVFLEALASSMPIIANDVGSIKTITGKGAIVFDGSNEEFARTIAKTFDNDRLYMSMSREARKKSKEYRKEKVMREFVQLYDSL